jgi:Tfp pilus assembly protein PilF
MRAASSTTVATRFRLNLHDERSRSRSIASIGLGLAYLSQGAADKAAEAFRDVAVAHRTTDLSLFMVLAVVGEASAYRMAGALDLARTTYDQAIGWSGQHSTPNVLVVSLHTGLSTCW